jgi:hypothetical protein
MYYVVPSQATDKIFPDNNKSTSEDQSTETNSCTRAWFSLLLAKKKKKGTVIFFNPFPQRYKFS